MSKRKHWYLVTIHACPICGHEKVYRERQYTPKPSNRQERIQYHEYYDWCDAF